MKLLLFLLLAFISSFCFGQFNTKMTIEYSKNVGDSFEIYVSLPTGFSENTKYNVIYYCDANLKSGRAMRQLLSSPSYNSSLKNKIFVGIGHIGNYHVLRRRDFILPFINGKDTVAKNKDYGHVDNFYSFLKDELIPSINSKYAINTDSNCIVGHSLGGLFAFYCLFKNDNLFAKYFALSPALWIDNYSIYHFNKLNNGFSNGKFLYFAAGGNETMNYILNGTNQAKQFLDARKYTNLHYIYDVHQNKTHNSEVPISLAKILNELL